MRGVDALVLDARLRQALVTVRSLGRRDLSVAAAAASTDAPAFSSRWCRRSFVIDAPAGSDAYLESLLRVLDDTQPRVVIPCGDATVDLLRRHRDTVGARTHLALASEASLAIAVNKEKTIAIAKSLRITPPRCVVVSAESDVAPALHEVALPLVVKPSESWLPGRPGVRVVSRVATTYDEAARAVADLQRLGGVALFQQLLSGRREAVSLLHAGGAIKARFTQWAKRTSPPLGGESVLRQSIETPSDIGDQAERLVRAIGLEGYSEVEFRRDDGGTPYLMEINPRLSASVEIAVRSGVDFPLLIHLWAAGEPVPTIASYRTGGWMRHLRGDLMTTIAACRQRGRPEVMPAMKAVLGFTASFFTPMAYDYLDWADLGPAVSATNGFLHEAAQSAVKLAAGILW
jgi:predicted ATP-grasp superfamily ATP-dependent carboligase